MNGIAHVAIIMDGNGRWAEQRGMPRWRGHEAGAAAVRRATEAACRHGIEILTLYAFSNENWKRPAQEIRILFALFRRFLETEREELVAQSIRLSAIGRRDRLSPAVRQAMEETEAATSRGERLHLRLAIDYGARQEILDAVQALGAQISRGVLHPQQIDEDRLEAALPGSQVPDPDLIIRTAGERRLSNFLLWQAAYSEFYFSPVLWPDFSRLDFDAAIEDYRGRTRRFGALATGTIG
jgi:undecaprenyl diphosphate synthase